MTRPFYTGFESQVSPSAVEVSPSTQRRWVKTPVKPRVAGTFLTKRGRSVAIGDLRTGAGLAGEAGPPGQGASCFCPWRCRPGPVNDTKSHAIKQTPSGVSISQDAIKQSNNQTPSDVSIAHRRCVCKYVVANM